MITSKCLKIVTGSTREQRKGALKEDTKHLLEELWNTDEEETSHKIFMRETSKGTHKVLRYSKEMLNEIFCREEGGSAHHLKKHEVGDICVLVHYQSHLITKELFPEDVGSFRFNSISRKNMGAFANHPGAIALVSSAGGITANPHPNTGLAGNFKVTYSRADSFKKSTKRDANLFTTLKMENIGMHGAGVPSPLLENRT